MAGGERGGLGLTGFYLMAQPNELRRTYLGLVIPGHEVLDLGGMKVLPGFYLCSHRAWFDLPRAE
jgi:hypothetical protein